MKSVIVFGIVVLGLLSVSLGFGQTLPADYTGAKVKVLVSDLWLFKSDVDFGAYWEPFADVFGDGTFAVMGNNYPEGQTTGMNYKVAFIDAGGSKQEYWAFYGDDKKPYTGSFNEKRLDGNPGRIACDQRPGGTSYIVGGESTAYDYPEFNSDNRWKQQFTYVDERVATVQMFNKTANGPVPISNVIDPIYGKGDIAGEQNNQMRYGGDIAVLSNGNFVAVPEDRNAVLVTGTAAIATIFDGKTGAIIKGPFNAAGDDGSHEIWSNVTAFKDGFAVRPSGAIITIYDNAGNMKFLVNQADWSTISDTGRGDDTRIGSNINSKYIYYAGKAADGTMVLSRLDATSGKADKEVVVSEDALMTDPNPYARADVAVDENDNVCVAYDYKLDPAVDVTQTLVRIFDSNLNPVTPSFFAFANHDTLDNMQGYQSHEPNVAMNKNQILITANGIFKDADKNTTTPAEMDFAVILENPMKPQSVTDWQLF